MEDRFNDGADFYRDTALNISGTVIEVTNYYRGHLKVRYLPKGERIVCIDCIKDARLEDTGFSYTMSLIQGKYKMLILYTLSGYGVVRFNEMKKYIGSISYKTLSAALKELEYDGLVRRKEYPQIPPKVEYSLTDRGESLIPILDALCEWGERHRGDP